MDGKDNVLPGDAALFALAPVGLCVSRYRGIVRCNEAFARMFGYAPGELAGQPLRVLYPSEAEYVRIGASGRHALLETGVYRDERIMKRRNGSLGWFRVRGRSLDAAEPFALALWTFDEMSEVQPAAATLSPREREIAKLVVAGLTSRAMAERLALSVRTVEAYRASLMKKLGVTGAAELVRRLLAVPD